MRDSARISVMIRNIQLLSNLCNEIQQTVLLTTLIVGTVMVTSGCLVPLLQIPRTTKNAPVLFMLLGCCVESIICELFVFSGMVTVHKKSKALIRQLMCETCFKRKNRKDGRLIRKFARSCCPIKIKFGANNFIEELTPLKCVTFALRLTVQILLLTRRG